MVWKKIRRALDAEKWTAPREDPGIMDPGVPEGGGWYRRLKGWARLDDPDMRWNPLFWLRTLVYGPGRIRRALGLVSRAERVADLGCGCGWFSLEVARRNHRVRVHAVDRDREALEWGRSYYLRQRRPLGEILHECADVQHLGFLPESQDAVVSLFCLGCLEDPHAVLSHLRQALRPGGLLVYYEATGPPRRNVERLARWLHRRDRWGGGLSDLWNQCRRATALYLRDAVRKWRPPGAPPEEEVFEHLQRDFEVFHHSRNRAAIDLVSGKLPLRRALFTLPLLKLADEAALLAGYLEGACRFVLARRP